MITKAKKVHGRKPAYRFFTSKLNRDHLCSGSGQEEWYELAAVKNDEVYICAGSSYFNRPGPRLIDSLEILTEIYHPTIFLRKYGDKAWIRRTSRQTS